VDSYFLKVMIGYRFLKRFCDIFFSGILILITLPVQLIISLILFFSLRENPIFFQTRGLTKEKFRFTLIKFKTIKSSAVNPELHHSPKDIFLIPSLALNLNAFEKWLRKTGLDELPQIYNVLFGQMSFIGPRPLMILDLEIMKSEYPNYYELRQKINCKPGITGTWQVIGNRYKGIENLISLDLFYSRNISFKLDLRIVIATVFVVLFAKNSDAIVPKEDFLFKLFRIPLENITTNIFNLCNRSENCAIKIPDGWWYRNNTYQNANIEQKNFLTIFEAETKTNISKSVLIDEREE